MEANLDLAKLVGAASAPVALIISSSIFLQNITGKYTSQFARLRELLKELRGDAGSEERSRSLQQQAEIYRRRLNLLILATSWMPVSIICFALTVLLTGLGVVFPEQRWLVWATGSVMALGLLIMIFTIVVETIETRMARQVLDSEVTLGSPGFQEGALENPQQHSVEATQRA